MISSPTLLAISMIITAILGLISLAGLIGAFVCWINRPSRGSVPWLMLMALTSAFAVAGSWGLAFMTQRLAGENSPALPWAWFGGLVFAGIIGLLLGLGSIVSMQLAQERKLNSGSANPTKV